MRRRGAGIGETREPVREALPHSVGHARCSERQSERLSRGGTGAGCVSGLHYLTGDRALQTIADLFRSKLRESDLIGRFGGEEFLLILPHTDLSGAEAFCHRLRDHVEKHPLQLSDQSITMTASFGVSTLSPEVDTSQKLLRIADRNLYRAKYLGRNRVVAECGANETLLINNPSEQSTSVSNSSTDTKVMSSIKSMLKGKA